MGDFNTYFLDVFKTKYAQFSGRARRKEYWMFILFNMIVAIVAMILDNITGLAMPELGYGPIYGLYVLATFIPSLALLVRRLHDTNKSGWMFLIVFIPLAGAIWLLVLLVTEGNAGRNDYGPDPKNTETNDVMDHLVE